MHSKNKNNKEKAESRFFQRNENGEGHLLLITKSIYNPTVKSSELFTSTGNHYKFRLSN